MSSNSHKDKDRDHKHSQHRSKSGHAADNSRVQATPDTPSMRNGGANGEDMDIDDHDADDDDLIDMLVEDATMTPDTPRIDTAVNVPPT